MSALELVTAWLRCPVCGSDLILMNQSVSCNQRHSFDVAKQGYVNLLGRGAPANADTPAMVAARDRFLSAGHYDPITDAVAAALSGTNAQHLLEVGAGTGHHLSRVLDHFPVASGLAADISVPACRRAARAHPRLAAVVANTWETLPLASASVDAVLCIFAPRNPAEFARVLRPEGVAIVVLPGSSHMHELREEHGLINIGEDKEGKLVEASRGHLSPVSRTEVDYNLRLDASEVTDLIGMGPNAFHRAPVALATAVSVSVRCITLRKSSQ